MKKLSLAVVALLLATSSVGLATQPDNGGPSAKRELGAPGYIPYKEYQLVRYGAQSPNDSSLTANDVVTWDCVSDDGITIGLVSSFNSVDAVAGVVVSTIIATAEAAGQTPGIDYGRRNWGWIQVSGYVSDVNMIDGPTAAGGSIQASTTARNATRAEGSTGTTRRIMGFAYDAWSGAATNEAQINL